jgi:hypothetical protein
LFSTSAIAFVSADREFIGRDWIAWLLSQKVPFRIRIKAGEWLRHEDGRQKTCRRLVRFAGVLVQEAAYVALGSACLCRGKRLRRREQAFLIVISSVYQDDIRARIACAGKSRRGSMH